MDWISTSANTTYLVNSKVRWSSPQAPTTTPLKSFAYNEYRASATFSNDKSTAASFFSMNSENAARPTNHFRCDMNDVPGTHKISRILTFSIPNSFKALCLWPGEREFFSQFKIGNGITEFATADLEPHIKHDITTRVRLEQRVSVWKLAFAISKCL